MAQRFSIIPARALTDTQITDQDLRVLNVLGLHTDKNGWCRPSLSLVAQYLSTPDHPVSYSTAGRRIVRLVKLGYINSAPRYGRNGERLPNGLQVRFDAPIEEIEAEIAQEEAIPPLQNDAQFGDPPSKPRGGLETPPPNHAGGCKGTTQLNAPVDVSGYDSKNPTDGGASEFSILVNVYQDNINLITPIMSEELQDALTEYGLSWCTEAIKETVKSGVRNWNYALSILRRWKKDGKSAKKNSQRNAPPRDLPDISGIEGGFYA